MRVALIGGLGAGKSTVGQRLAARGAIVIDVDQVARDVIRPGSAGLRAVLERFGDRARARSAPEGQAEQLDRKALADIVFTDTTARLGLEEITHPLIRAEVARQLAQVNSDVTVIELPLLDRKRRLDYQLDVVVLVDAPEETAVRRAVKRGMAERDARARMAAQPTTAERRMAADRVLVNDGDLEQLESAVDELWAWLIERLGGRPARDLTDRPQHKGSGADP